MYMYMYSIYIYIYIYISFAHLPDVVDIWVMFGRSEDELDSLGELHTTEGGVGQVEEDSQHHCDGDVLQHNIGQGS